METLSLYNYFRNKVLKNFVSETRLRIAKGAFWGSMGSFITKATTVILSFFLARILGKESFGEYGIIISTVGMINGFAGLGIGTTVTRYIANLKIREPDKAGRIIALSSVITWFSGALYCIIFIDFAPWLATNTLAAPHLAIILQISSISIGLGVVNSVQVSTLTGLEAFKTSSIVNTIQNIFQSLLILYLSYKSGVKGAIIALAISSIFTVIIYFVASRKMLGKNNIKISYKDMFNEWHIIARYSLPAFLSTITVGPVLWASNAFLANQPKGYEELGVYNAAQQISGFIQYFPTLISTAVLPVMSDLIGRGEIKSSIKVLWKMMNITAIVVIPLAIGTSIFSPIIMNFYGKSFIEGYWVTIIAVWTTVLICITNHLGTFIAASGKMWIGFTINLIWGMIFVLSSYFLVKWGAIGLAASKLIAYIMHAVWSLSICLIISKKYSR